MTDLDSFDFQPTDSPPNPAATPKKCYRHSWMETEYVNVADGVVERQPAVCVRCGRIKDEAASRRGRLANRRGRTIQAKRNKALGITNIVGNAVNHDGGTYTEMFVTESKSGGSFPERPWRWLKGIPFHVGQTPILIVTDTPGAGHRARSVVILDYDDWRELHGGTTE